MKLKLTIAVVSSLVASALSSSAATVQLINLQGGPGTDTIWAKVDGMPMNGAGALGGIVSVGYFGSAITSTMIDTIEELVPLLPSFTILQSGVPGTSADFAGPGYLAEAQMSIGNITGVNPLIGRSLYAIATDANGVLTATIANGFSLFLAGTIKDDVPFDNAYVVNPAGVAPLIGKMGSWVGDAGLGAGAHTALQLVAIPETSTALLGALGALGLLRRRR